MARLLFGTAGVPLTSARRDTVSGIERISQLGLGCMEVEFVRGVRMGKETAILVKEASEKADVELSVHGPYYINLNSPEDEKVRASRKRIIDSAIIGGLSGARDIVFHPGFYMKNSHQTVYSRIKKELESIIEDLDSRGCRAILRPETTGKKSQFGELDELLSLSRELDNIFPCFDFSHIYARERGAVNDYESFTRILEKTENSLGKKGIENMHIHVSGIEYSKAGERRHLLLEKSSFNYLGLLEALKDFGVEGKLICESPNLEDDALKLQKEYKNLT